MDAIAVAPRRLAYTIPNQRQFDYAVRRLI